MKRLAIAGLALVCAATSANAQLKSVYSSNRMEISAVAGYMWGGSAYFASAGTNPGGNFEIQDAFMWGADLAFRGGRHSWVELTYRRQDTQLHFIPNLAASPTGNVALATNMIHIGGRQDFVNHSKFTPYIRGSLGATVFDNKGAGKGSSTDFSLSIGGGFTFMLPNNRVGIRANLQGWFSFVPSNQVGVYCDPFFPYYCYATTTSQTVSQGEVSGALVFRF